MEPKRIDATERQQTEHASVEIFRYEVETGVSEYHVMIHATAPEATYPYLFENEAYTAEQGATAFDALKALCDENGISLKYQRKTYIQGIAGLNEKDCGGSSGWTYRVNGELIKKPASSYTLQNGDVIEWRYVTNPNE